MWDADEKKAERAVLIGLDTPYDSVPAEESLSELYQLARTAGAKVLGKFVQSRTHPNNATYAGRGKIEQVKEFILANNCNLVIIDDELTPTQEKNLEEEFNAKVIDRTRLILDIFAIHASSSVGKLQVELAQLEYYLPRLKLIWTEFSKLGGGIGTRMGPGEKKIEIDRRMIRDRINSVRKKLERIRIQRRDRRKQRKKTYMKSISLVGYTNSGKSTLMNLLTGSDVGVANKLFSTLSTTTRKVKVGKYEVFLTDTVGFIRKLPHKVVEAFMATLEQVQEADLLLHVVDVSDENYRHRMEAVNAVLSDLRALDKPVLKVFNKIDKTDLEPGRRSGKTPSVYISAKDNTGIEELKKAIELELDKMSVTARLRVPQSRQDVLNSLYEKANILNRSYEGNDIIIECQADKRVMDSYERYMVK